MSDTSYAAVSQLKRLVDIADDEWLQDHLSDDGIMELLWFSFIEAARQLTPHRLSCSEIEVPHDFNEGADDDDDENDPASNDDIWDDLGLANFTEDSERGHTR
jgi:hypothetical protein